MFSLKVAIIFLSRKDHQPAELDGIIYNYSRFQIVILISKSKEGVVTSPHHPPPGSSPRGVGFQEYSSTDFHFFPALSVHQSELVVSSLDRWLGSGLTIHVIHVSQV